MNSDNVSLIITIIGLIGGISFGVCAIPQVVQVWKTNDTKSISKAFLLIWANGEIFTWLYVGLDNYRTGVIQYPLHLNYLFNGICLAYLIYKKFKGGI